MTNLEELAAKCGVEPTTTRVIHYNSDHAYFIDRAPDSFELRECLLDNLYLSADVSKLIAQARKDALMEAADMVDECAARTSDNEMLWTIKGIALGILALIDKGETND